MAELLVRVKDKVNPDSPQLDAKCLKAGDVVVACPDGWEWSELEKSNPDWLIVKVPGMSMEEAKTFTAPEVGDRLVNPMLRQRAFKIDLEQVQNKVLTAKEILGLKVLKEPLDDPSVIG